MRRRKIANMKSYIRTHVNRTGRWIEVHMRPSKIQDLPDKDRLAHEIMQFLVKRETSLADTLESLTMLMVKVIADKYGKRNEFFHFYEQVSTFLGPTERDLAVVALIPLPGAAKAPPRTVTMVERPEGILRLANEVSELITKFRLKSFGDGINALTGTMLTAIEATCDQERANEFDLLIGGFLKWMQSQERVQ
jgi:hypothetical protein